VTVRQLREQLQGADPDAPCLIAALDHGYRLAQFGVGFANRTKRGNYYEDHGSTDRERCDRSVPALLIS